MANGDLQRFTGPTGESKWVPTHIDIQPRVISVFWTDFGRQRIDQPFFIWTMQALQELEPPADQRVTGVQPLLDRAATLPRVEPAGLIFHVSRCGSSLIVRSLQRVPRAVVLGEMAGLGALFYPWHHSTSPHSESEWTRIRRAIADAFIALIAVVNGEPEPKVVLKFQTASLLHIQTIRRLWPAVPAIVLIRHPLEVLVSNYLRPAGWVGARHRSLAESSLFGWPPDEERGMTAETYIARGLGALQHAALPEIDNGCQVVDYESLSDRQIETIGTRFGLLIPPSSPETLKDRSLHTKDRSRTLAFTPDGRSKRDQATVAMTNAVERWALQPYRSLRSLQLMAAVV